MPENAAALIDATTLVDTGVRFSICTLVTRQEQYSEMLASFRASGFGESDCEFIQIDNRVANRFDAYQGCNLFLTVARGEFIVLCHQDILLIDQRADLERALADLEGRDPSWALCGNSGGMAPGRMAIRLTDPHGTDQRTASFPARVFALDENFIVVRRSANLGLSSDMSGFHLYGADLCIQADVLGRSAYVVDFHLKHLSGGKRDETLTAARDALVAKYRRAFRGRWVKAPCELVFLTGSAWLSRLLGGRLASRIYRRIVGSNV